jgi:hypothetical protein
MLQNFQACNLKYFMYTLPSIKCREFVQPVQHFLLLKPVQQKKKMLLWLPRSPTFYSGGVYIVKRMN